MPQVLDFGVFIGDALPGALQAGLCA